MLAIFFFPLNEKVFAYGRRHKLSNTLVFWGFIIGWTKKTFLPRNRSRKMISGWYSVYPAPNGVPCLFRFDGNSGFAKSWWLYESAIFYWSKTSCPRISSDDGRFLRAIVDTISGFWCIPMSKPVPNQMPDLIGIHFKTFVKVLSIHFPARCCLIYTVNSISGRNSWRHLKLSASGPPSQ